VASRSFYGRHPKKGGLSDVSGKRNIHYYPMSDMRHDADVLTISVPQSTPAQYPGRTEVRVFSISYYKDKC
jgi:hypothetical protein